MAQFDVHRNPGRHRGDIPFVVVLQSRRFDAFHRRLVAPLFAAGAFGADLARLDPALVPRFLVRDTPVYLNPFLITSIPDSALGEPVASLAGDEHADRVVRSLDEVFARSYG